MFIWQYDQTHFLAEKCLPSLLQNIGYEKQYGLLRPGDQDIDSTCYHLPVY